MNIHTVKLLWWKLQFLLLLKKLGFFLKLILALMWNKEKLVRKVALKVLWACPKMQKTDKFAARPQFINTNALTICFIKIFWTNSKIFDMLKMFLTCLLRSFEHILSIVLSSFFCWICSHEYRARVTYTQYGLIRNRYKF